MSKKTVPGVIKAAGGPAKIAARVGLTADAVRKWPGIGIPDRHWQALIGMARRNGIEMTPEMIFAANCRVRAATADRGAA